MDLYQSGSFATVALAISFVVLIAYPLGALRMSDTEQPPVPSIDVDVPPDPVVPETVPVERIPPRDREVIEFVRLDGSAGRLKPRRSATYESVLLLTGTDRATGRDVTIARVGEAWVEQNA